MNRPPFLTSLLEALQLKHEGSGWRALIPYWLLISAGLGGWLAWSLPSTFWDGSKPDLPIAIMAGVVSFDGLVLALSWSSFGKIFEIVGAGDFSAFLRRHKLLSHYLVTVDYVHGAQIIAIMASGFALFAPVLELLPWAMKLAFAVSIGTTIYAARVGVAASAIMQDLIWQRGVFDSGKPIQNSLRPVESQR